jgi:hypothetical protein
MSLSYSPGADALPIPPAVVPDIPLTLHPDLQARFDSLTNRDETNPELGNLRRDIAQRMRIPFIAVRIGQTGVSRHDLQRGEILPLPAPWLIRIRALNSQIPPAENADWERLREEIAQFTGLPLAQIGHDRPPPEHRYTFRRS